VRDGTTGSAASSGGTAVSTRLPVLQRPMASYYLLLASVGLLLVIGLVMVFSASSVRAYADYESSSAIAAKQAIYIGLGLPCLIVASRLPVRFWRAVGTPLLLAAIGLLILVLVPGVGRNIDGATRWIPLPGGFNLQPSELSKLALALWGADLLVRKKKLLGEWKHLMVPLLPVSGFVCLLVMLEPDMGTTMATISVVVALLWVVGTPMRYFAVFFVTLVLGAAVLAVSEPYRLERVLSFRDPFADPQGNGYQAVQGLYALSSGGWFGVGLGASEQKWSGGLPNAHTDFIFAIIGEELGLLGTFTVLGLIATLAYAGIRVAQRTDDPFVRLAASAVTAWLVGQSLINIAAVVGLVPITGIPLPLVSFGGSAMIPTLVAVGMLLSFARAEPGVAEALARRRRAGADRRASSAPRGAAVPAVLSGARRSPGTPSSRTPSPRATSPRTPVPRTPVRAGSRPAGTAVPRRTVSRVR
jgi:cell division protein FtsW